VARNYEKVDKAFIFFEQKLKKNETFKLGEVASYTGWSEATVRTYANKRWLSFLEKKDKDYFLSRTFAKFTQDSFRRHHSQKDSSQKYFYEVLVDKAVSACISAIEIYNKPDFKFREESFSILMVNAWELILKAKILKDNNDDKDSIYFRKGAEVVKSEAGNAKTISISKALNILESKARLNKIVTDNVRLLVDIRDESVHFVHVDAKLAEKIQAIGMGSLKNFMTLCMNWFDFDFAKYNFYLMPVSFFYDSDVTALNIHKDSSKNLLSHLETVLNKHEEDNDPQFSISLTLETKLVKTSGDEALQIRVTDDPSAPEIKISEEDALKNYPYTYSALTEILHKRYKDFRRNREFNQLMRELKSEGEKFCKERRLDPINPKSLYKMYYHRRILEEFDKHYTKK
jgi:hypothetical protein